MERQDYGRTWIIGEITNNPSQQADTEGKEENVMIVPLVRSSAPRKSKVDLIFRGVDIIEEAESLGVGDTVTAVGDLFIAESPHFGATYEQLEVIAFRKH